MNFLNNLNITFLSSNSQIQTKTFFCEAFFLWTLSKQNWNITFLFLLFSNSQKFFKIKISLLKIGDCSKIQTKSYLVKLFFRELDQKIKISSMFSLFLNSQNFSKLKFIELWWIFHITNLQLSIFAKFFSVNFKNLNTTFLFSLFSNSQNSSKLRFIYRSLVNFLYYKPTTFFLVKLFFCEL